jgi:hypothetical protein
MKRMWWLLALGACEGGQSPSSASGNISLAQMSCTVDNNILELTANAVVTLEIGQSFTISFLPAVNANFDRMTTWTCDEWLLSTGGRGCTRDPGRGDVGILRVVETNLLTSGSLPASFEVTTVGSITEGTLDVESVLVKSNCP